MPPSAHCRPFCVAERDIPRSSAHRNPNKSISISAAHRLGLDFIITGHEICARYKCDPGRFGAGAACGAVRGTGRGR
ncbi:hypothetical protein B0H17DRAFT_1115132 [Mycena rosella]|uniref:Uncharacterized protein n=1 Tax=Mycena rosella TaxID=1033263 RepID=A0AAD7FD49_MYCRO|nr:hypothetical protein B0H17DRAFT_1115132 [Mycena rosella]